MKNLFFLMSVVLSINLFAYVDSDFDGVEDKLDRCPNTPFSDLVDISGCTTKSLISPYHYDIIVGATYSDSDYQTLNQTDTLSTTVQVDYYYKNFSLQASTSYFYTSGNNYSDTGFYDSFIGAAYQFKPIENLSIRVSGGALLPTYETTLSNNNTDYVGSLSLSYTVKDVSLFAGYSYTVINDDDVVFADSTEVVYQNSNAYNGGIGYYLTNKLYMSGSYNVSNSIYRYVEDIETLSVYGYYSIDDNWFSTLSYARGLSDSASKNYMSLRLGYFF